MILSELPFNTAAYQLTHEGLKIKIGRFNTLVKLSPIPSLLNEFYRLYQHSLLVKQDDFIDFPISLLLTPGVRSFIKPQINFDFCGLQPFEPLPAVQALPLLEWGMNWCVSQHYHDSLIIHAAVIEKYGKAIVLPGLPGAGKSTLCAGLVHIGGWRLLSDELTLIDLNSGKVLPNPRPISLKNQSINILDSLCPDIYHSNIVKDTAKGSVSLFQAPIDSVRRVDEAVDIKYVIFPRFIGDIAFELSELSKGRAFIELANQSFNYSILGELGFKAIAKQMDNADCFELTYDGNLHEVAKVMEQLALS
ncbi:HprK-related kinase A [Thalassotalea atypica]|uniref:HprK-related kinase A n=1 Tax=Thalassotalea atypica TaxID=2054316 RepID=UPI0025726EB8|nr:HprK-related kinase A [Thalassotalea atypica]